MIEWVNVNSLTPAPYNPRRITAEQSAALADSLRELGCILPPIVNRGNRVIIAGHQRTKAAKAAGIESVPCFFVEGISTADEMTFNQLHNGTDQSRNAATLLSGAQDGFSEMAASDFRVDYAPGTSVKEVCKLILRYGNVFCAVVCGRRVFIGAPYIKACQNLRLKVNVSAIPAAKMSVAEKYLTQGYGEYSYDSLPKETYVQGLAQLFRHTEKTEGQKQWASMTYERLALPYISARPTPPSVLDFGCGRGAYITALARRIPHALGVEFYNNNRKAIDIAKGNRQIDALCRHLERHGRFDVVICDSVLNSVDSMDAELSVLGCLNALCRQDGRIFCSGRSLVDVKRRMQAKVSADNSDKRMISFLDSDNFTAILRAGHWYYQHYHDRASLARSLSTVGLEIEKWFDDGMVFRAAVKKARELTKDELTKYVGFEFSLPLPGGRRYRRAQDVLFSLSKGGFSAE